MMPKFSIGDLIINILAPDWAIHENFKLFTTKEGEPDIECRVIFQGHQDISVEGAQLIMETPKNKIYEINGNILNISGDRKAYSITSKDWSAYKIYINSEYNNPNNEEIIQKVKNGILASLRDLLVGALAQKNGLIIHSSTIIWQDKGIVFSAPSDTGKTTHTLLWQQMYQTPVLDGDVTACRINKDTPVVYGLPWCGTSGQFINASVPLGAIVFLQQCQENSIIKLDFQEAFLRLTARCFLLPWNQRLMDQYLNTIQKIVEKVSCYLLNCLPNQESVELVKECLKKQ